MKEKLLNIINNYGERKQLKYFQSEVYEFNEAILTDDGSNESLTHITEEIADVMVMLKQFQYQYDIKDEEIEKIMNYKIDRQLDRIENAKEI